MMLKAFNDEMKRLDEEHERLMILEVRLPAARSTAIILIVLSSLWPAVVIGLDRAFTFAFGKDVGFSTAWLFGGLIVELFMLVNGWKAIDRIVNLQKRLSSGPTPAEENSSDGP